MQRYELFHNNSSLKIIKISTEQQNAEGLLFSNDLDISPLVNNFINNYQNITFLCPTEELVEAAFEKVKHFFRYELAAGGIVTDNNDILAIRRYHKWDFPKGHVEDGETDEQAAHREIAEETGIDNTQIIHDLGTTHHIFRSSYFDGYVLKRTHWYWMKNLGSRNVVPQTEENIKEVRWFDKKNINTIKQDTYPSVLTILNQWESIQQ